MIKVSAVVFLISSLAFAQQQPSLSGRLPAAVPAGAEIVARVVSDAGEVVEAPLARTTAEGGRFELLLPATIDHSLLEEERLGCAEDDLLDLAYLPFLFVEQDGTLMGRLLLTDLPRALWRYGMPAKHAYFLYTDESFSAEGACGPGEISVALEAGWNPLLVIADQDGMRLSSETAPDTFTWHFDPRE